MAIDWEKVARTKVHAIQVQILDAVADGSELSPAQFARDKGIEVGKAGYHFRSLEADGFLRMTREQPVRGAVEHFYALSGRGAA